jgi:8-oxo-dGTP pyrophosphatase MutT (NUDIX family)
MTDAIALLSPEPTAGSGELDEIAWLPLANARALDLPAITRFVLAEVADRLAHPDRAIPFVRMVRGQHQVTHG